MPVIKILYSNFYFLLCIQKCLNFHLYYFMLFCFCSYWANNLLALNRLFDKCYANYHWMNITCNKLCRCTYIHPSIHIFETTQFFLNQIFCSIPQRLCCFIAVDVVIIISSGIKFHLWNFNFYTYVCISIKTVSKSITQQNLHIKFSFSSLEIFAALS